MSRHGDWDGWNQRLALLLPESLRGAQLVGELGQVPQLVIDGIGLTLAPSHWGLGESENDAERVEEALEVVIQGHAPDYWRNSNDPLVQALGWLDRRIGRRSWRQYEEEHGSAGRNPLEQQVRALRQHAEERLSAPALKKQARP